VTAKTRRRHSAEFQANAVRKLNTPGQSAQELADELEVRPSLLYRWRRAAQAKEGPMSKKKSLPTNKPGRRPQDWTTEQKLAVVLDAQGLAEEQLGGFLRQRGLHEATLGGLARHGAARGQGRARRTQRQAAWPRGQADPRARARAGAQGQGAGRGGRTAGAPKKFPSPYGGPRTTTRSRGTDADPGLARGGHDRGSPARAGVQGGRADRANGAALGRPGRR